MFCFASLSKTVHCLVQLHLEFSICKHNVSCGEDLFVSVRILEKDLKIENKWQ